MGLGTGRRQPVILPRDLVKCRLHCEAGWWLWWLRVLLRVGWGVIFELKCSLLVYRKSVGWGDEP